MTFYEYVWNTVENQWQVIEYVWPCMNMYELLMKPMRMYRKCIIFVNMYRIPMGINENV